MFCNILIFEGGKKRSDLKTSYQIAIFESNFNINSDQFKSKGKKGIQQSLEVSHLKKEIVKAKRTTAKSQSELFY